MSLFRVGYLSIAIALSALALQSPVAHADECDDAYARFKNTDRPGAREALIRGLSQIGFGFSVDEAQKRKCEGEKAFDDLSRINLNAARQVHQICGARVTWDKCDVACQERSLAESEKRTAYDCSPAALEEARNAEQQKAAQREAERKADDIATTACAIVASEASTGMPDKPEVHEQNLKLCNAAVSLCEGTRDFLTQEHKSAAGLTCSGQQAGPAERAWLGVGTPAEFTAEMARNRHIDPWRGGALVFAVVANSPAQLAGIAQGDVIVRFDAHDIRDAAELTRAVDEERPGKTVDVVVMRDSKQQLLYVTLGRSPQ